MSATKNDTEIRRWLASHSERITNLYSSMDNSRYEWREFLARVAGEAILEAANERLYPASEVFRCGYSYGLYPNEETPLYFRIAWNRDRIRIARPELQRLETLSEGVTFNEKFGEYRRNTYISPSMRDVIFCLVENNGHYAHQRFIHKGEKFLSFLKRWTGEDWEFTSHSIAPSDCVWTCEHCGESYPERDEDSISVIVSGHSRREAIYESWCSACADNHAERCEISDECFSDNYRFADTEDTSERYCVDYEESTEYLYYDEDGNAYRHAYNVPDDEDEDEEEDDYGIGDYQSRRRPSSWQDCAGYGVELEIYAKNPREFSDYVSSQFILERDGSLCNAINGIEIVGPPAAFNDLIAGNTVWEDVFTYKENYGGLYGHDAHRKNGGKGVYGMHVNISNSLFADNDHKARFVTAITRFSSLCRLVAQRDSLYSSATYDEGERVESVKSWGKSKYSPCATHANRVEVRIFRSNTRKDRFLKNIEFCEAMRRWTERLSNHFVDMANCIPENGFAGFAKFVERNKNDFKNLYSFLKEKGIY